jgi:hypothetical protein
MNAVDSTQMPPSWMRKMRGRRVTADFNVGPGHVAVGEGDRRVLLRLIAQLSKRRVLFDPLETENYDKVVWSTGEMRTELSAALGELSEASDARAAVHRMLDAASAAQTAMENAGPFAFMLTLGWLRGIFGAELASLSDHYAMNIEGALSSLLVVYDAGGKPLPHKPPILDIGREVATIYIEPQDDPIPRPGEPEPDTEDEGGPI